MAQTKEGALKIAAKKAGVSIEEYQIKREQGLKWCTNCREWHPTDAFGVDRSRWDGLVPSCKESKNTLSRTHYVSVARDIPKGRNFVEPRDDDRKQARRRVNYFVEAGLIPHPNTLPCTDCGHSYGPGKKRHEYDHYLGYGPEHHEDVEAVCLICHRARERKRRLEAQHAN